MHWWSDHFHLGDVPTWFAAVGAGIAAVLAFGQLRAVRSQLQMQRVELADLAEAQRHQMEVLELEIRDRRESQARAVLITMAAHIAADSEGEASEERMFNRTCTIENASSNAIAMVRVVFKMTDRDAEPESAYPLVRDEGRFKPPRRMSLPPSLDRMDPNSAVRFVAPACPESEVPQVSCEVRFTDAAGRRWLVDAAGQLREDSEPSAGSFVL